MCLLHFVGVRSVPSGRTIVLPVQKRTDNREHGGVAGSGRKSPRHKDFAFEKSEDPPGHLFGRARKGEGPCPLAFLENEAEPVDIRVVKSPDFLPDLLGKGRQVGGKDGEQAQTISLAGKREEQRHIFGQTRLGPGVTPADLTQCVQKARMVTANQGARQIVFFGKMVVDAGGTNADPVCDIAIAEGVETPQLDQFLGGIKDDLCRVWIGRAHV